MTETRPARVPAWSLAVTGIFSLQFGAAIAQTQYETVGPVGAALLRLVFASVILFAVLRPRFWRWSGREWLAVVVLGLALGGMNVLIYLSFQHIPIGVAITIEFLGPLTLALVQIRRWADAVWAALALGGVALIGLQATVSLDPLGIAFAVGAGVCWVGYILATANLGRRFDDASGLAMSMLVATLVAVPLGWQGAAAGLASPLVLGVFALVAVMSSVVPYALELKALRTLPTRVFGILQSLSPGAAAVAGLLILGQALDWRELAALVLVTVASIGVTVSAGRAPAGRTPIVD